MLILTTGFQPRWEQVVADLKRSGKLDERVEVRNFFAHSRWVRQLGVPPVEGPDVDADGLVTKRQQYGDGPVFRLADYAPGVSRPSRFRYFDQQGRLFLTTGGEPGQQARAPGRRPGRDLRELAADRRRSGSTRRSPTCPARSCSRCSAG